MSLPPYAQMFGIELERQDNGPARLVLPFSRSISGRPGFIHGGALGGLLEIAGIVAVRDALGGDATTVKPVTLTVDFMRGGRERATYAAGTVRRLGSRIANVDAIAWQDDPDQPIAAARLTFALSRPSGSAKGAAG